MNIIFLDIDGVLNCQIFYTDHKNRPAGTYVESQICKERISWLNELCKETGAKVVVSSTWRLGRTVQEMIEIFQEVGGMFEVIGLTPDMKDRGIVRGNEIYRWLQDNINPDTHGCHYYDFRSYAIIDDDSDMLLWQQEHLFKVDHYSGLTPNTCYKIKRFFQRFETIQSPNTQTETK